ncbi:hypothetical protein EDD27_5368 [Nonomuraea polychroma]|uniref:DUF3592 domain-containing protein n=1 Tax=Nonomuraea polychroma TaxID=46176 RepID=A0A438MAG0_9ACTN|nr:DUF3592 domain-containing protein [Nonomuraea polychroma]RVX42720.1 hypothetical protein EDD27_5368 [Nonomuraea polychroma]
MFDNLGMPELLIVGFVGLIFLVVIGMIFSLLVGTGRSSDASYEVDRSRWQHARGKIHPCGPYRIFKGPNGQSMGEGRDYLVSFVTKDGTTRSFPIFLPVDRSGGAVDVLYNPYDPRQARLAPHGAKSR